MTAYRDGRWVYGEPGCRFPVQPGETWRAGPHTFYCGDLTSFDAQRFLRAELLGGPDWSYVDPPWDAAAAGSYRTKAAPWIPERDVPWPAFLQALMGELSRTQRHAFVECGRKGVGAFVAAGVNAGGRALNVWNITYYRRREARLIRLDFRVSNREPEELELDGADDSETPRLALQGSGASEGETVMDPCVGRGLTALAAQDLGLRCVGVELHPRRLSVALSKLNETGVGVDRVSP